MDLKLFITRVGIALAIGSPFGIITYAFCNMAWELTHSTFRSDQVFGWMLVAGILGAILWIIGSIAQSVSPKPKRPPYQSATDPAHWAQIDPNHKP